MRAHSFHRQVSFAGICWTENRDNRRLGEVGHLFYLTASEANWQAFSIRKYRESGFFGRISAILHGLSHGHGLKPDLNLTLTLFLHRDRNIIAMEFYFLRIEK